MEVNELITEAIVRFSADVPAGKIGMRRKGAEAISGRLGLSSVEFGIHDTGQTWIGRGGIITIGKIQLPVDEVGGNARCLYVKADTEDGGLLTDALDTLLEICTSIHNETSSRKIKDNTASMSGDVYYGTMAVVTMVTPITKAIPWGDRLSKDVQRLLKEHSDTRVVGPPFTQFSVNMKILKGARELQARVTFEQRADTEPSAGIYFTQSPLRVDDHLEVLKVIEKEIAQS